jgi:transposase, IS30 family
MGYRTGLPCGHPGVPESVRQVMWRARSAGASDVDAAAAAGVDPVTARRWIAAAGGVAPQPPRPRPPLRLSRAEREEISRGLATRLTPAEIARRIGRHRSTVGREIARHGGPRAYRAHVADRRAQWRARRPKPAKLAVNGKLREQVQRRLKQRWSPQQIAARLPVEFPDDPEMRVSHETIYTSLFVQSRGALRRELTTCLRTGRAVRKPRRRVGERRGKIPGMVMIADRPAEAADRAVPGHWEGDLIVGKNGKTAIGTLVERSTRFVLLLHLPDGATAERVTAAMTAKIGSLPAQLRRSLTWDQGKEMAYHARFSVATGVPVYFCDPHSPWQRGTNENTNGLLRQYFPKGTDLSVHSGTHLDLVAAELNGRPRQTLGWNTPAEALHQLLPHQ